MVLELVFEQVLELGLERISQAVYENAKCRGRSSVGRALRSQRRGQGFDSPRLHHFFKRLRQRTVSSF
jgi:hypothetical protein